MVLKSAVIESLAFGGNGVCRIDGKVCFVSYSCPGDEVAVNILKQKKTYSIAEIAQIINPSIARKSAECSVYGSCGGCGWQHINYSEQLEQKRKIVQDALSRVGGISNDVVNPVVPSRNECSYRSRFRLKTAVSGGLFKIGFFKNGSHEIVDLDSCVVASPELNDIYTKLKCLLPAYPDAAVIEQVSVDSGLKGVAVTVFQKKSLSNSARQYIKTIVAQLNDCSGFQVHCSDGATSEILHGTAEVCYSIGGLELLYYAGGFSQVNRQQNEKLLDLIKQFAAFEGCESLLDLYCGNGNFSLPLSKFVASVIGVEGSPYSASAADRNTQVNSISNVKFICSDVNDAVSEMVAQGSTFDVVLLDPPRAGAADVVANLVKLSPKRIVYVSCDPTTLARDCRVLNLFGYVVKNVVPVDMFPQTYHIESVTLLVKE